MEELPSRAFWMGSSSRVTNKLTKITEPRNSSTVVNVGQNLCPGGGNSVRTEVLVRSPVASKGWKRRATYRPLCFVYWGWNSWAAYSWVRCTVGMALLAAFPEHTRIFKWWVGWSWTKNTWKNMRLPRGWRREVVEKQSASFLLYSRRSNIEYMQPVKMVNENRDAQTPEICCLLSWYSVTSAEILERKRAVRTFLLDAMRWEVRRADSGSLFIGEKQETWRRAFARRETRGSYLEWTSNSSTWLTL